jgi:hypothetical protein
MIRPIYRFLADDHVRLDGLLRRAATDAAHIDRAAYAESRAGLLKHIGMEEKILLPAAQRARGPGGLYETCDEVLNAEADDIIARLRAAPEVPVNPHVDSPLVFNATRRAVARAGYDLELPK